VSDNELERGVDGFDMKDQDPMDKLIAKNLGSSTGRLPSNFSYLVMQKIARLKVERARSGAVSQSVLISLISCLLGVGLLMLHALYTQAPMIAGFTLPTTSALLPIGGGVILLVLVVFDGFFASRAN